MEQYDQGRTVTGFNYLRPQWPPSVATNLCPTGKTKNE
jgi:hypothetical protein